jgi:putative permease
MRGNWITITFSIIALAAFLLLIIAAGNLVKLVVVSALLAYIIEPLAVFLEARGMSRTWATLTIFLSTGFVIGFSLVVFLPVLGREMMAFQEGLKSGQAAAMISRVEGALEEHFAFLGMRDLNLLNRMNTIMVHIGNWIFSHILDVVALITHLVIVPFIAFFLLKDGREIKKQFIRMIPNRYFEFSLNLLYKMDLQLGNYLRGQFLDATIFGVLSVFALWLLGVKYFLIIGIFAGLANLIPFLGPLAGAAPAIIVSVLDTGNFAAALSVIIAFALIKLIDDALVQPLVVAKSVHMHPIVVLLAVIIGGKLFGILGMLLSVPVACFIKVVVQESIANYRRYYAT